METPRVFETDAQRLSLDQNGGITSTIADDDTVIMASSVESVTAEDDGRVVLIRHSGGKKEPYFAETVDEAAQIASAVAKHLNMGDPKRVQQTAFDAGIIPGSFFLMALLTTFFLSVATYSAGVLVVGGVLTTATLGYLCYKLVVRRFKTVYSRA